MTGEAIIKQSQQQMQKAADYLVEELKGVRTGRASPGLVEHLKVQVPSYGSSMNLRELASVSAPEPALLVIKPFDPTVSKDIEKAILASNLGLTPMIDGAAIRLPIPPLSGERRQQLMQEIKRMGEAQKVAIRNARRDSNKHIEALKTDHKISEDQAADFKDETQKLTKKFETKIDEYLATKQKELQTV